jgi:alpha-beta hydrolase superfamily lysophospholipase
MKETELRVPTQDGGSLFVRSFLPETQTRGVVQIVHGMAEHSARYARLAQALTQQGFAVYADDHRGHGQSATSRTELGHFSDRNGWDNAVGDELTVLEEIRARHRSLPVILLGHSMGSYIARTLAIRHGERYQGLILSGTSHDAPLTYKVAGLLAKAERLRLGKREKSPLLRKLSFEAFNAKIQNPRTPADWLSRDPAEVDKYNTDPFCGFECTTQLWVDLFGGLVEICTASNIARMPKSLPVLIIAGEHDPLNNRLAGIRKLHRAFESAGIKDLTQRIYAGARHELFNETNRDEVTRDVLHWLEEHVSRA